MVDGVFDDIGVAATGRDELGARVQGQLRGEDVVEVAA